MIVPLEFRIERVEQHESDVDRGDRLAWGLSSLADAPVYHVLATVLDTERDLMRTYDLHTLVSASLLGEEVGMVVIGSIEANREYLTGLRDRLSEVLT